MSISPEKERAAVREERTWRKVPTSSTSFRPLMSAILPKGTWKIEEVRRKAVATQLRVRALIPNSLPMEGRAMLTDDPMKDMRKEARVVTSKTGLFSAASADSIGRDYMNLLKIETTDISLSCLGGRGLG